MVEQTSNEIEIRPVADPDIMLWVQFNMFPVSHIHLNHFLIGGGLSLSLAKHGRICSSSVDPILNTSLYIYVCSSVIIQHIDIYSAPLRELNY